MFKHHLLFLKKYSASFHSAMEFSTEHPGRPLKYILKDKVVKNLIKDIILKQRVTPTK